MKCSLYKTEATWSSCELIKSHDYPLDITTFSKQFMNLKQQQKKVKLKISKGSFQPQKYLFFSGIK